MARLRVPRITYLLPALLWAGLFFGGCRDEGLAVLFYNVQNLFDAKLDGTEYREFASAEAWNETHVKKRLTALAKVIRSAPKRPDLVALAEVENAAVLRRLNKGYLDGYPYEILAPDPDTAVRVAVLSAVRPVEVRVHRPSFAGSRSMLELRLSLSGGELALFVCHWKSRLGGARETEPARIQTAHLLAARIRELERQLAPGGKEAHVLLVGDLNESPDEGNRSGGAYPAALTAAGDCLVRLAGRPPVVLHSPWLAGRGVGAGPPGSYSYRGEWEAIDQVLADPSLADGRGQDLDGFCVVAPTFALDDDGRPSKWDTKRLAGYSDHLPVFFEVRMKPNRGGDD